MAMSEARDRGVPVKDTPPAPALGRLVVRTPPRQGLPRSRKGAAADAAVNPHSEAAGENIESPAPVASADAVAHPFAADDLSFLKLVLASVGAAILVLDREGSAVFVNREARELFRVSGEPGAGNKVEAPMVVLAADGVTPLDPRDRPIMRALVGELVDGEEICIRHAGSDAPQWLMANARPIVGPDARILGAVGLYIRIDSPKARKKSLLKARDAALIAAGAKTEFMANMSHEIRTPLSAIVGMTRLLLDSKLSAEQREFAETVGLSVDSLISIVNDVLDFSKITAGKLKLEAVEFSPIGVIESVVETFAEQALAKRIELASSVHGEVLTAVIGDPSRLRQVLINLVGNAIKFTEHGSVLVELSREPVTADQVVLRFSVRDTGIGISLADQRRLFQPFSQAETSTTRMYGGTGLGLAICTRLVELMSGSIGVESAPGEGSTFWFTVPFHTPDTASTLADEAVAELAGLRVLIADDSRFVASALCQQLVSWSLDSERASSAAETLDLLRAAAAGRRPFDVVLIGTEIGRGGAIALAKTIRSAPDVGRPRLVATYPLGHRPNERQMRDAGLCSWIAKPMRPSQLLNRLAGAMAQTHSANVRAPTGADTVRTPSRRRTALLSDGQRNDARILLAEDHAINQRVALMMLKKLGYHAHAVANGREVINALNAHPYDLVLMDCQMPDLDGYEATRRIRQTAAEYRHIPIVGVTAHALEGDREKCLAAGMDDYLTKPILPEKLGETVERWLAHCAARNLSPGNGQPAAPNGSRSSTERTVDVSLIEAIGGSGPSGDATFVGELIDGFLEDLDTRIAQMKSDLADCELVRITHNAHALKGSAGHFGAAALICRLATLETLVREDRRDQIAAAIDAVECEAASVKRALVAIRPRRSHRETDK
jgi:signal transduction histidine kinase/CheY-like chemotaxis protein/HPt (histidine-containing phosphotransfer) domain-containing protein